MMVRETFCDRCLLIFITFVTLETDQVFPVAHRNDLLYIFFIHFEPCMVLKSSKPVQVTTYVKINE